MTSERRSTRRAVRLENDTRLDGIEVQLGGTEGQLDGAWIFHVATLADWEAAVASGRYTTSTYGLTLAEEGFLHASRADQWEGVLARYYARVTEPLVLLSIDTDRLDVPVVEEPAPGGTETFPHVYGPLSPDAVVAVTPLERP